MTMAMTSPLIIITGWRLTAVLSSLFLSFRLATWKFEKKKKIEISKKQRRRRLGHTTFETMFPLSHSLTRWHRDGHVGFSHVEEAGHLLCAPSCCPPFSCSSPVSWIYILRHCSSIMYGEWYHISIHNGKMEKKKKKKKGQRIIKVER